MRKGTPDDLPDLTISKRLRTMNEDYPFEQRVTDGVEVLALLCLAVFTGACALTIAFMVGLMIGTLLYGFADNLLDLFIFIGLVYVTYVVGKGLICWFTGDEGLF